MTQSAIAMTPATFTTTIGAPTSGRVDGRKMKKTNTSSREAKLLLLMVTAMEKDMTMMMTSGGTISGSDHSMGSMRSAELV